MLFDNFDFDIFSVINNNKNINNDGYQYGNMFTDEYVPYKDYPVYVLKAKDEKNNLLLKIMEESFIINDLNLYLDINSNDKEVFSLYKKHNDNLKKLINEYENKYQALTITGVNDSFSYVLSPWPWEGYNV